MLIKCINFKSFRVFLIKKPFGSLIPVRHGRLAEFILQSSE